MFEGFDTAYQEWSWWVWFLYAFSAYAAVGFIWFWFRFHWLESAAQGGMERAVRRYNQALRGFPNAVFAKMLGKKPLEQEEVPERSALHQ